MRYYTLQKNEQGELHLFEAQKTQEGRYISKKYSICNAMEKDDGYSYGLNEDEARTGCAEIGRRVCGACVSHLYGNYNQK